MQLSHMSSTLDHENSLLSWKWSHVCPFEDAWIILFLVTQYKHALVVAQPSWLSLSFN